MGEICERVTRKNKNGESDLPLTIASQYGLIDQRDFFNHVVAAKNMSNYYLLRKGEFAYNKSYSNGFDYGSIKRLNAYEQGCLSTLYICFGITSEDVESDYLECYFDTLKWYGDVSQICAEGARNHGLLNVDTKAFFDEVTIEIPSSKEEQKKISAYLNNIDNLITLHQRKCINNTIKHINDWEQRKLSGLCENITVGIANSATHAYTDDGIVMFRNQNIKENYLDDSDVIFIDEEFEKKYVNKRLKANDLLVARTGYPGTACVVPEKYEGSQTFTTLIARLKGGTNPFYACQYINSDYGKKYFLATQIGGGQKNSGAGILEDFPMILPPTIEEQERIANFLKHFDNLITLHQR